VVYQRTASTLLPAATAFVAAGVFIADATTPPECVVSGLYIVVVLMASRFSTARRLWIIAACCTALTILAQIVARHVFASHAPKSYIGTFNSFVSVVGIGLSTYVVLRGKSAEMSLRQAQTDLVYVSRVTMMGELTAAIGHEVNQPIAAIVTNAGACLRWLSNDPADLEKARAAAARIVRDGNRAADIISRIRQIFSKGSPERLRIDINKLVRDTIDLVGSEAARYGVSLRLDLAADLPEILADPVQLQQVMVNLAVNGIDAMKGIAGPRQLSIASLFSDDAHVIVSVKDTGSGLPATDSDKLFDAFFTTKPHGTGLGLSISRSIIEAHHGRLWAAPNLPNGATFLFALPIDAQ
jgi:C4-dicarboxylate-specific signal transduction histidine kinase